MREREREGERERERERERVAVSGKVMGPVKRDVKSVQRKSPMRKRLSALANQSACFVLIS